MERQPPISYQLDLFTGQVQEAIDQSELGASVSQAQTRQESQLGEAGQQERALTRGLMQAVCSTENIREAYKQVKRNKGVAGIDQMPVDKFSDWYVANGENLISQLLKGTYYPQAVRQVCIPKPNGGERTLGIPTVTDRIIQQAIAQVLSPIYERKFSDHSYGFRPKRSAHQALQQASKYVAEGRTIVVDMDMASFFDEVNHDKLMYKLSQSIGDKTLLRLIRKYLRCGILQGGLVNQRQKGTPQGSPLSPLLSNIVLDSLDKELEKRGHCFVRYADDVSIFVRSQLAGERVLKSISTYITKMLKLKVNEQKSVVCQSHQTKLLGYTIYRGGNLGIATTSLIRFKEKIRRLTKRNRGKSFERIINELNLFLRGWMQYFKLARSKRLLQNLDAWIRRKLRCYRLKQCKKTISLKRFLHSLGVANWHSWTLALSGKGHWCKSGSPQAHQAMNLKWFEKQGLYNLFSNHQRLTIN